MSRSIALISLILVLSFTTPPNAEATRYDVNPVELSDRYAITGGFIETDVIGPLMEGDITDYQINVEGEVPHVFSPSNQGASIYIEGTVLATGGQILHPPHSTAEMDIGVAHQLEFSSSSSSVHCVNADRCRATIEYLTVNFPFSTPGINYYHSGIPSDNDWFTPDYPRRGIGDLKRIVVATVPEPSTVTLIFLGGCVYATRRRRKA